MFRSIILLACVLVIALGCGSTGAAELSSVANDASTTDAVPEAKPHTGALGDPCVLAIFDAGVCPALAAAVEKAGLGVGAQPVEGYTTNVDVACRKNALGDPVCTFECQYANGRGDILAVPGAFPLCTALGGSCFMAGGGDARCWMPL